MTLPQGRIIGTHRGQATGGYGIADVDRPQRRQPIDLDAIAEFNEGVERAADDYYLRTHDPRAFDRRVADAERARVRRARMKEQK